STKRGAAASASSPSPTWSPKCRARRYSSLTGNRHLADQEGGSADGAARVGIGADRGDVEVHALEIAGDGHFLHRVLNHAVLDPETARAARVVAGHAVDTLAEELGHEQAAIEPGEELGRVEPAAPGRDDQVVDSAGVAGALEPEPPRRITAEHVAVEHAIAHQLAIVRG